MTDLATNFTLSLRALQALLFRADPRLLARIPGGARLHNYLDRTLTRFLALLARWRAGTLPSPRPRAPRPARPSRPRAAQTHISTAQLWVVRLFGHHAAGRASQLTHMLATEEAAEFLRAAPQAGRLLRPLARILGVQLPPQLALPPRTPRPCTPPEPRPPLHDGPQHYGKYTIAQIKRYSPGRIPRMRRHPPTPPTVKPAPA